MHASADKEEFKLITEFINMKPFHRLRSAITLIAIKVNQQFTVSSG